MRCKATDFEEVLITAGTKRWREVLDEGCGQETSPQYVARLGHVDILEYSYMRLLGICI